jgi:NADPH:quinone reductase-like Zn-dependent oxidoreductase
MKAAEITHFGHADAIQVMDVPAPKPNKDEVLIEVHA